MATFLSLPTKPPQSPNPNTKSLFTCSKSKTSLLCFHPSKRDFAFQTAAVSLLSLTLSLGPPPNAAAAASRTMPQRPFLSGISNTRSWFQFIGDGFSIRIPPQFEDVMEPEVMPLPGEGLESREENSEFLS
ncbi:hypothetical protein ACLOJK_018664 [Asimina triloba]